MTSTLRNWQPAILWALAAAAPSLAETATPAIDTFAKLPLAFEANQGQTDPRVAFMAHGIAYSVFLTKQEAVLALTEPDGRKNVLRMGLAAANPDPVVSGPGPTLGAKQLSHRERPCQVAHRRSQLRPRAVRRGLPRHRFGLLWQSRAA